MPHQVVKCGGIERALRLLELIRVKFKPGKSTRRDLVRWVMEEFGCSRATGYRTANAAIDVLGLDTREEALDALATAPAKNGHAPHANLGGGGFLTDRYVSGSGLQLRTSRG